jgi:hypothetical protein
VSIGGHVRLARARAAHGAHRARRPARTAIGCKSAERSTHWPLQRAGVVTGDAPASARRGTARRRGRRRRRSRNSGDRSRGSRTRRCTRSCRAGTRSRRLALAAHQPRRAGEPALAAVLRIGREVDALAKAERGGAQPCSVQVPEAHCVPTGQMLPQVPQLLASKLTFTQAPLQSLKPGGQVGAQVPPTGRPRAGKLAPHEPQLAALEARSTHWPSHSAGFWPIAH